METSGTTVNNGGADFICFEADCSDASEGESENNENAEPNDETDFISNVTVEQGNSLALHNAYEQKKGDERIQQLKRKLQHTPWDSSPRAPLQQLQNCSPPAAKRGLFLPENEAATSSAPPYDKQVDKDRGRGGESACQITALLRSKNLQATLLAQFKELSGVGFKDLSRHYKHCKTTNLSWICAAFGALETLYNSSLELLKEDCEYLLSKRLLSNNYNCNVFLCSFKKAKCKDTVKALFAKLLNVNASHMLCDPPNITSHLCGLYWLKLSMSPHSFKHGEMPMWLARLTMLEHSQASDASKFNFGRMVQWAYDSNFTDEAAIAYWYAVNAETDANAAAWLACPNQARYVRDCSTMVRHYKHAERANLSMSQYINKLCSQCTVPGNWKDIMYFLKHQNLETITLVNALQSWLKGVPKKNTIFIVGPPDTGKSLFAQSLMHFLQGTVLTFAMSKSQFWLQPLFGAKAALVDDATSSCLNYFDQHMRSMLDGYSICIDRKHRNPVEIKAPPLLVTTNIDINTVDKYFYLRSRVTLLKFPNKMPVDDNGQPLYKLTDGTWNHFFKRLWSRLELSDPEDEEDDESRCRTLKCFTGDTDAAH